MPTTQISIFIIFISTGVLFEGALGRWDLAVQSFYERKAILFQSHKDFENFLIFLSSLEQHILGYSGSWNKKTPLLIFSKLQKSFIEVSDLVALKSPIRIEFSQLVESELITFFILSICVVITSFVGYMKTEASSIWKVKGLYRSKYPRRKLEYVNYCKTVFSSAHQSQRNPSGSYIKLPHMTEG